MRALHEPVLFRQSRPRQFIISFNLGIEKSFFLFNRINLFTLFSSKNGERNPYDDADERFFKLQASIFCDTLDIGWLAKKPFLSTGFPRYFQAVTFQQKN